MVSDLAIIIFIGVFVAFVGLYVCIRIARIESTIQSMLGMHDNVGLRNLSGDKDLRLTQEDHGELYPKCPYCNSITLSLDKNRVWCNCGYMGRAS